MEKVMIRVRLSAHQAHYGGGLVDGAYCMQLFGDVATRPRMVARNPAHTRRPAPSWAKGADRQRRSRFRASSGTHRPRSETAILE